MKDGEFDDLLSAPLRCGEGKEYSEQRGRKRLNAQRKWEGFLMNEKILFRRIPERKESNVS